MIRHCAAVLTALLLAAPVAAVIVRLVPLRQVLATEEYIFVAKVERLDPAKPAAQLAVTDDMKGHVPFRRLPVSLTGDGEAQRAKQTPQLLERLAQDMELVVF